MNDNTFTARGAIAMSKVSTYTKTKILVLLLGFSDWFLLYLVSETLADGLHCHS